MRLRPSGHGGFPDSLDGPPRVRLKRDLMFFT